MIGEALAGSRCPGCQRLVVPAVPRCPDDATTMEACPIPSVGEVVSFTTLYSPPEGFRSPLHIALVELDGGARLFCHGEDPAGIKIGWRVAVEAVDSVFYFSHLGMMDRARLFWRRAGARGEKVTAITKSLVKGFLRGRSRGEG